MNPHVIAEQLLRLSTDLDNAIKTLGDLEATAVDAEGEFKVKYSRAFRNATGSVEDRKQFAIEECATEWHTWGLAASAARLQRDHLKALHTRIDVGRTLASNVRAEVGLARTGVTP